MSARLLLSCGEPSGDLYAGALTRALREIDPSIAISGLGGPQFAAAGGRQIDDYRDLAVTGLSEALAKVPRSFTALRRLLAAARDERPDAVVLIDFPDFNFRLGARLKPLGVPIVYYIAPQIWAWRPGRLKTLKALADRVLVIFPFEEALYRDAGVPVEFVGHPLIDLAVPTRSRSAFLADHGLDPTAPTVAILPGSRPNELRHILPDLAAAAGLIRQRVPKAQFVVARAPSLDDALFAPVTGQTHVPTVLVEGDTDTVLTSADVTLTASGTATVQAALHGCPMVIVYRVSPWTYRIGRRLVKLDTFGMVNLIAGRRIVPELIQGDFTPDAVAREATAILADRARADAIRRELADVRARLGEPGASRRAARAVLEACRVAQA